MMRAIVVGMYFMAGPAGPAFRAFVHVHEVEVFFVVSEIGFFIRYPLGERSLVMTGKTERVLAVRVGRVKFRGVVFDQQAPVIRSMGVMTGSALVLPDRAVPVLILLQKSLHVSDRACFRSTNGIVASEAEGLLLLREQFGLVGSMHFVAGQALLFARHGAVLDDRPLSERNFVRVAIRAERRHRRAEHGGISGSVGIMAHDAGLLHRKVCNLSLLETLLFVCMTHETKGIPFLHQHLRMISLVCVMTGGTTHGKNGRVHNLVLHQSVRMTLKTNFRRRLSQHAFIRRLVRVVTRGAVPAHDRPMDNLLGIFLIMAHITEISTLLC